MVIQVNNKEVESVVESLGAIVLSNDLNMGKSNSSGGKRKYELGNKSLRSWNLNKTNN